MSKNYQTMTFLPLFGHTERSLGRFKFLRGKSPPNSKFWVFRKRDLSTFPTSYDGPNLDVGKASKSDMKVALCFWPVALRLRPFLLKKPKFTCFDCELDFSLLTDYFADVIDDMACKCNIKIVLEGRFIS